MGPQDTGAASLGDAGLVAGLGLVTSDQKGFWGD